MIERQPFFQSIRSSVFRGRLRPEQVAGMEEILEYWETHHPDKQGELLDYLLATTYHETAGTMQPIQEYGGPKYFTRMYDIKGSRPQVAKRLGNLTPGDGIRFSGKGFVQITGRRNFEFQSRKFGVDFVSNPEKVMEIEYATPILVEGCLDGDFTGKGLEDYIRLGRVDFKNARRVVNGLDDASQIAGYAYKFKEAREAATAGRQQPTRPIPTPEPRPEPEPAVRRVVVLRKGSKGAEVYRLQRLLIRAGIALKDDRIFGDATERAVIRFQTIVGLKPDGIVGRETWPALEAYENPNDDLAKVPPTKQPEVVGGGAVAGGGAIVGVGVEEAKDTLQDVGYQIEPMTGGGGAVDILFTVIQFGILAAVLGGVGFMAYGWWKRRQTKEA